MKCFALSKEQILWFLLSGIAYFLIAYWVPRSNFPFLIFLFGILFICLIRTYQLFQKGQWKWYVGASIFFRFIFFFAIPSLSDDFYRFIWDGQLQLNGINPFQYLPSEVNVDFSNKEELLEKMNSPNYYSVYPPMAQWLYLFAVGLFPQSILGAVCSMRFVLLLAEIISIFLIPKILALFEIPLKKAIWYVLNPLIVVELVGNLHQEALVVCFLLIAIYFLKKRNLLLSSFFWALSAASKLIPLLLVPFLFRFLKAKKWLIFSFLLGICFCLLWLPFMESFTISNIRDSINLYFQHFEFNASLYYLIRAIGQAILSYNPIAMVGAVLPKVVLGLLLIIALKPSNKILQLGIQSMLLGLSIYYIGASIVHPWYIAPILLLGVFTPYYYPIAWSFLALLSYHVYQTEAYQESMLIVCIEYLLLFAVMIYDLRKSQPLFKFEKR